MSRTASATSRALLLIVLAALGVAAFVVMRHRSVVNSVTPGTSDTASANSETDFQAENLRGMSQLSPTQVAPTAGERAPEHGEDEGTDRSIIFGKLVATSATTLASARAVLRSVDGDSSNEVMRESCGAEGQFELEFRSRSTSSYRLDLRSDGCVPLSFSWARIPTGARIDLGTLVLRAAGSVVARVHDTLGNPVEALWAATLRTRANSVQGLPAQWNERLAQAADRISIEGLPEGAGTLIVSSPASGALVAPDVEVREGQVTDVELTYEGPELSRRLTVIAYCTNWRMVAPSPEHVMLTDGHTVLTAQSGGQGLFYFDGLDAHQYSLIIDDPQMERTEIQGVMPGETRRLALAGSVSLILEVRDSSSGEPLQEYNTLVELTGVNFYPKSRQFILTDEQGISSGHIKGLLPRPCKVSVDASGHAKATIDLDDLRPGEARALEVPLQPGATIEGRVHDQDGKSIANADVAIVIESEVEVGLGRTLVDQLQDSAFKQVREDGSFEFDHVGQGAWIVAAKAANGANAQARVEVRDSNPAPVELLLMRPGYLSGRITPEALAASYGVVLAATSISDQARPGDFIPTLRRTNVRLDGSFRLGPLAAGDWKVEFLLPGNFRWTPGFYFRRENREGTWFELDRVRVLAGEDRQVSYDLENLLPGSLRVDAQVDHVAAEGCVFELMPVGSNVRGVSVGAYVEPGVWKFDALLPGQWRLILRDEDYRWAWFDPELILIQAGSLSLRSVVVELFPGQLGVVTQEDGSPLADSKLLWNVRLPEGKIGGWLSTEGDGRVRAKLPLGEYRFFSVPEDTTGAGVSWTMNGPSPETIMLPRGGF